MINGDFNSIFTHLDSKIVSYLIKFIERKDLENLSTGTYYTENNIRAVVINTKSRSFKGIQFETHRKFLDFHCLIFGKEVLGFTPRKEVEVVKVYNEEQDVELYFPPEKYSWLEIKDGQCVLFYPDDAHCAQGHLRDEQHIIKVVFKLPLDACEFCLK